MVRITCNQQYVLRHCTN